MRRSTGFTLVELIVVLGVVSVVLTLMITSFRGANEAARRISCMNNLRQLHLGLQSYHSSNGAYPPGVVDHVRPYAESHESHRLGWNAMILPYAEQFAIYQTLNFDVSAESPANLTARGVSMSMFACPNSALRIGYYPATRSVPTGAGPPASSWEGGPTNYVGCHDPREKAIDVDDRGILFLNSRVRADDVFDGLSQTILLGEVARPADPGWLAGGRSTLRNTGSRINGVDAAALGDAGKSAAWRSSDQSAVMLESLISSGEVVPPPGYVGGFSSLHRGDGAVFAFGDGSIRFLRSSIDPAVFARLGDRDDGEDFDEESF